MLPKISKPCSYHGCPELTLERYCTEHKRNEAKRIDQQRGSAASRGYGTRWRKARKYFLMHNPFCVECERQGTNTMATVVDHIVAHKGDYNLFWSQDNWQSLCASCHGRKTAKEDGRWG